MAELTSMTPKKRFNLFSTLFMVTYMVSYLTRINFGAVIVEMVDATGIARSLLSLAVTGAFFTYGAGQIISGFLGDRFQPKNVVLAGLLTTSAVNLALPFFRNYVVIIALWCVNGIAQAFIWPPLVRLMTYLFDSDEYARCAVRISCGSCGGTILVYIISPLIISIADWRGVFWFCGSVGVVMALVWNRLCFRVDAVSPFSTARPAPDKSSSRRFPFSILLVLIMITIVFQGALRDGVTTWMPSFISENYDLGNAVSILTGAVLPVFSILCLQFSAWVYRRFIPNPVLCAGLFFGIATVCSSALWLFRDVSPLLSVVLLALFNAAMHSINQMQTVMVPSYFKNTGNVSLVSGVLNSSTYIGSSLSIYGIALISERSGWGITLLLWAIVALAGTALCLAIFRPWDRYVKKLEKETV